MKIESFSLSDVGRSRQENEDSAGRFPDRSLYVVADGMGGHAGGKRASSLAVDTLEAGFGPSAGDAGRKERLAAAIAAANRRIFEIASQESALRGMGTTLVALAVDGATGWIASVGDSRAYRVRAGRVEQLTRDHSLVADLLSKNDISEEEARHHPYRHVLTRALGVAVDVDPDVVPIDLLPHDAYVLCSDGVYGMIDPDGFEQLLLRHAGDPERLCRELVTAANAGGGKDNATAVAVVCLPD